MPSRVSVSQRASTSQLGNDPRFDISKWSNPKGTGSSAVSKAAIKDAASMSDDVSSDEEDDILPEQGDDDDEHSASEDEDEEEDDEDDEDEEDDDDEGENDDGEGGVEGSSALDESSKGLTNDRLKSENEQVVKPLSEQELAAYEEKRRKRGIIYISRIPHGMTVAKVRHLLSGFGEVERLYLQDGREKEQGQKLTGRKAKTAHFTEGWVEFADKRVAKAVAEMLNAQPIGAASGGSGGGKGGKKAGGHGFRRWKDEVWTMKYLSGFKWYMLSEQLANERASRASRVRAELSQSAFEQKDYLRKVERARVMREKEARRRAREEKAGGAGAPNDSSSAAQSLEHQQGKERSFRQREAITRDVREMRAKRSHDDNEENGFSSKRSKPSTQANSARDESRSKALQGALSKIF